MTYFPCHLTKPLFHTQKFNPPLENIMEDIYIGTIYGYIYTSIQSTDTSTSFRMNLLESKFDRKENDLTA